MVLRSLPVLLAGAVGCARGVQTLDPPDAGGATADARSGVDAPPGIDAPVGVDAPPQGAPPQLLLTEVVLAPSTGEFVEIANLGATAVDLSAYYLTDAGSYFRLPSGVPTVDSGDFIARFPAGATIAAHGVITVALDTPANFTSVYGGAASYSVAGGSMTTIAATGVPSLTNAGELVVLFRWDGVTDLVGDVDLVLAGVPTVANGLIDKSGVAIDGPDADGVNSSYATDARTVAAQPTAPAANRSTKRIAIEAGFETQAGFGNGLAGDDETSEDTGATWDTTFTVPTPGAVPTSVMP